MRSVEVVVNVSVDDVLDGLSMKEKEELYYDLAEELSVSSTVETDDDDDIVDYLRDMTSYEIKKVLCNVLGIPSYVDTESLRAKLEPIITA